MNAAARDRTARDRSAGDRADRTARDGATGTGRTSRAARDEAADTPEAGRGKAGGAGSDARGTGRDPAGAGRKSVGSAASRGRTTAGSTSAAGERTGRGAGRSGGDTERNGKRAGTARTDGRGRRLGAGGIAAIPGSSGGTRGARTPPQGADADDPAPGTTADGTDESGSDTTGTDAGNAGTATRDDTAARRTARTGATPRPRPVRPAPHIVRRRRIALLVVVLVLLGGLAGGVAFLLYGSGLADVETVTVDGALAVPRDQVLAAAAIPTGGPLVGADTSGAEQRVAALPGVASVTVGRDWPHTVVITVVERVAVALADTPKGLMLVDRTGVPYEQAPEVPPVLPHLDVGIAGRIAPDDPQTTAGLGVLAALPDAVRAQVLTVTVIAPATTGGQATVELTLSDDRRVVWGSPGNGQRKAAVLTALLTEKGSVFDVASPDLPTIRR
ncbi:cell division protein FtsQ [Pseudonocardia sp. N23]|nr:cell division protein FtsQ [Pseudonocardia sp. N23]